MFYVALVPNIHQYVYAATHWLLVYTIMYWFIFMFMFGEHNKPIPQQSVCLNRVMQHLVNKRSHQQLVNCHTYIFKLVGLHNRSHQQLVLGLVSITNIRHIMKIQHITNIQHISKSNIPPTAISPVII